MGDPDAPARPADEPAHAPTTPASVRRVALRLQQSIESPSSRIKDRSFGSDEELARELARLEVEGLQAARTFDKVQARASAAAARDLAAGTRDVIELSACGCAVDASELRATVLEWMQRRAFVRCPVIPCPSAHCYDYLTRADIEAALDMDEFEAYEALLSRALLAQRASTSMCPQCGHAVEFHATATSDPASSRLRCRHCNVTYCTACGASPFHEGLSCGDYRALQSAPPCRFCRRPARRDASDRFTDTCEAPECARALAACCAVRLACGHRCAQAVGHDPAPHACLACGGGGGEDESEGARGDELCALCMVDELRAMPCVFLSCGHVVHLACMQQRLEQRWSTAFVSFGFLGCPVCHARLCHPLLQDAVDELTAVEDALHDRRCVRCPSLPLRRVQDRIRQRLARERRCNATAVSTADVRAALRKYAYYECSACKELYFGGLLECNDANLNADFERAALLCPRCACAGQEVCREHGEDYLLYKCRFCCNIASWFCWGTTHFCDACHARQVNRDYVTRVPVSELPACRGGSACPAGGRHGANGREYIIACSLCRAAATTAGEVESHA